MFLAVIHPTGREAAAASLAEACKPRSITRLPLTAGGLVMCRWDDGAIARRGVLACVDGTGGAPEVPVPFALTDTGAADPGLTAAAREHRSYLWLDAGGRLSAWTDH